LSDVYIRSGNTREKFSMIYHEMWDVYHPYVGDKATLYYLFLLRYRNNDQQSKNRGKSWRGRKGIVEKFQIGYATLPLIDDVLKAVDLVDIETRPSGNGADKIYYTVHDPLTESEFETKEAKFCEKLRELALEKKGVRGLLGKEKRGGIFSGKERYFRREDITF
jgi:replication initiation and membrane attachment protein DnaB